MTKAAFVTGAGRGIGLATASLLIEHGYRVFLGIRDAEQGRAAALAIDPSGEKVIPTVIDVTSPNSIAQAAERVEQLSGGLDLLVNNAGVLLDGAPPSSAELDTIRRTYETNVFGALGVVQAMLPSLKKGSDKTIVNVSSELGSLTLRRYPDFPFAEINAFAYNSSKTLLNALTVSLAQELRAEGFCVMSISPGYTATDLNGNTGSQSVEEAADVIVGYVKRASPVNNGVFLMKGGMVPC